ncbi:MAG: 6-phospho-3-hexuloisomerase [Planctomycetota bacterium]|nr:MAG: 6-phospho-3-hexuloisomerase [Planctomycetota bacterium]
MPLSGRADRDAVKVAGQDLYRRIQAVMERIDWDSFLKLTDMLPSYQRTFLTGAGRSGLVARMFGMRLMHAGLTAYVTGETITPAAGEGDLLVAISCTGATCYTEYLVRRAKELGARVVVISSVGESPLARLGDDVVIVPAIAEDIVTRAAVFEHATSLCLDAVFNVISGRLKIDAETFKARHANLE